jgi:hypothetical protein
MGCRRKPGFWRKSTVENALVGLEGEQFRCRNHSSRARPKSDFERASSHRPPSYLFGCQPEFLFAPLTLGSYFALPVFALLIPIIAFRLLNEKRFFAKNCPATRAMSVPANLNPKNALLLVYRHNVPGWTITAIVCLIRDRI